MIAAAHAATQAISTIRDDVEDAEQSLRQSLESGDTAAASVEMRRLADLASQAQLIGQMTGAAPQQQAQSQYTQVEIGILRDFQTELANDPRKFEELRGAAQALIARGYDRNSEQYGSALRTFLGRNSADSALTPDGALEIVNNSKFGKISADDYNRGVEALATLKKAGIK